MGYLLRLLCMLAANLLLAIFASNGNGEQALAIPQTGVTFLTGDSWQQAGQRFRLYGVQSCLRGTYYSDKIGQQQDCGAVSTAMLAAYVRDLKPSCLPVAQVADGKSRLSILLVICTGKVGEDRLDLGATMITQGFAFAAINSQGHPVYFPYAIEEGIAQQAHKGLWAFPDLPLPNSTLLSAQPIP